VNYPPPKGRGLLAQKVEEAADVANFAMMIADLANKAKTN